MDACTHRQTGTFTHTNMRACEHARAHTHTNSHTHTHTHTHPVSPSSHFLSHLVLLLLSQVINGEGQSLVPIQHVLQLCLQLQLRPLPQDEQVLLGEGLQRALVQVVGWDLGLVARQGVAPQGGLDAVVLQELTNDSQNRTVLGKCTHL